FHAFFSGWCYWTNNLIYVPALLIVITQIALFVGGVQLERGANSIVIISLLWLIVGLNVRGLDISKWLQSLGGLATFASVVTLVGLCLLVLGSKKSANPITMGSFIPSAHEWQTITALGTVCFALVGLELGSVMAGEIKSPKRNIPIAIFIAGPCCI